MELLRILVMESQLEPSRGGGGWSGHRKADSDGAGEAQRYWLEAGLLELERMGGERVRIRHRRFQRGSVAVKLVGRLARGFSFRPG